MKVKLRDVTTARDHVAALLCLDEAHGPRFDSVVAHPALGRYYLNVSHGVARGGRRYYWATDEVGRVIMPRTSCWDRDEAIEKLEKILEKKGV